jgi:tetratricopeptide (TPR) repeat protein
VTNPPDFPDDADATTSAEDGSTFTLPQRIGEGGEAAASLVLPPGTAIGRYLVLDHLGAGGMGTVHAAWDRELQRKIALKLVRPERKAGEGATQARARFLREAQALAQISHPNVVAVFDLGPWGDEVYLAMEFVEGRDLRAFLGELPPADDARRWPRLLEIFREIGRGLQAVHAAGLVHRDVKPANLMIGNDGRARVMDFGLARRIAEAGQGLPADSPAASPLEQNFTSTGLRIGTPSYMAPEQFLGLPCDQRADVFSFSVALFEALYGRRPFGDPGEGGLEERLLAGRIEPRPAGSPVPEALHRVVLRGLAREPEDRWPRIGDLLDAADAVPRERRRKRRLAAAAGALAVLVLLGFGLYRLRDERCADAGAPLEAAFGQAQKEAIVTAFRRVGANFGPTGEGLVAQLEAYGSAWAAQRRDACEDTHHRGEQSEELLDRRMFCLDRRLAELRSAAGLLATADLALVESSQPALDLLGDLDACADLVQLASGGALPPAEKREQARFIQQDLIDAKAHYAQHPGPLSRELTEKAAQAAERLGYPPLLIDARLELCGMDIEDSRIEDAYASCLAATAAAIAGDDAAGLARAAGLTAWLESEVSGKPQRALGWMAIADAAAARLGRRPLLAARLEQTRGLIALRRDEDEAGLSALRKSLELAAGSPQADQRRATINNDLAIVLLQMRRFDESEQAFRRALELNAKVFGPHHPNLAGTLNNLGSLHYRQKHYEDALQLHLAALDMLRRSYGEEHRLVALTKNNVATALRELGRHEEAEGHLLRAIAILERLSGPENPDLARPLGHLAGLFREREPGKALALYSRAHGILIKSLGEDALAVAASHQNLGITLGKLERFPEARRHLERSYAISRRSTDPRQRGGSAFELARLLWQTGQEEGRRRLLAAEALAEYRTDPGHLETEIGEAEKLIAEMR